MSSEEKSSFLVQIIVASTRPGRVGLPIGEWVRDRATEYGFEIDFADLAVVNLPFLDEPKHPRLRQYEHQHTKDWSARVDAADAFILVMPEYNYSFTAPLKNAIDFVSQEWGWKPVATVSYGGVSGGTRAVQAIKQSLLALKMVPLSEAVVIPFVTGFMKNGSFEPTETHETSLKAIFPELKRVGGAIKLLRG